jgi:nicotinamide riboside transporter PnuC
MESYIQLAISVFSILSFSLLYVKNKHTFTTGVVCQLLYFVLMIYTKEYGFLPMTLVYLTMNIMSYFKWSKDEKHQEKARSISRSKSKVARQVRKVSKKIDARGSSMVPYNDATHTTA